MAGLRAVNRMARRGRRIGLTPGSARCTIPARPTVQKLALPLSIALVAVLAAACSGEPSGVPRADAPAPTIDPCIPGEDPELLLQCDEFSQERYWLGPELEVPGGDALILASSYVDDGDEPISSDTRLVLVYGPRSSLEEIYLSEWHRPAWETFLAGFTGYDPSTVPVEGPINWWQHPCVDEQVYIAANGAEVHLFRAHLASLIFIPAMTAEEVSACLDGPVGALGAHVYFDTTVIEFSVQDQIGPDGPPEEPVPIAPGTTPPAPPTPSPPRPLVLRAENPYNDEAIVRHIVEALRPFAPE